MIDVRRLGSALEQAEGRRMFRLGTVSSASAGPPATVLIDGNRRMRYLDSYSPTPGDEVLWIDEGSDPVCLGNLA